MKDKNIFALEDEFFVIQSDKLDSVHTKLYGYCLTDNAIITDAKSLRGGCELTPDGAYIFIERADDKIIIRQDFVGCYGLYLYREGNYWALSNSFHYLVDKIKGEHFISFNKEYADHLLTAGLAAQSYSETLINEIKMLDRATVITINAKSRKLKTKLIDYKENTLDLNSPEGMETLDKWVDKWTYIIRSIKADSNNISTDLSGGYDSRVVLGLFLKSGINLNEICINSSTDGLHSHIEDYEIASSIAEFYNFTLNNKSGLDLKTSRFSLQDILAISFNIKLGFHTQMYWQINKREKPRYIFTGSGITRNLAADLKAWQYEDSFIENQAHLAENFGLEVVESVQNVLTRSFSAIKKKYNSFNRNIPDQDICYYFYRETRTRNHYGKAIVENFMAGNYSLCPLLDSDLSKIKLNSAECTDSNLLVTVIFDRYNSSLLNFKIEGGRFIEDATKNYAIELNKKYPYKSDYNLPISNMDKYAAPEGNANADCLKDDTYQKEISNPKITANDIRELVKSAFYSPTVKETFEKLYSTRNYFSMADKFGKTQFYPESDLYTTIAISKIYMDCNALPSDEIKGSVQEFVIRQADEPMNSDQMEEVLLYHPYIRNFITARIDIKNCGEGNDIEFLEVSDNRARISAPSWFAADGTGYVIESSTGRIFLRFKCINSGLLRIYLRSKDIKDNDNHRILIRVDYTGMAINGENIFEEKKCISHDNFFKQELNVSDGDIIHMELAWTVHDGSEN